MSESASLLDPGPEGTGGDSRGHPDWSLRPDADRAAPAARGPRPAAHGGTGYNSSLSSVSEESEELYPVFRRKSFTVDLDAGRSEELYPVFRHKSFTGRRARIPVKSCDRSAPHSRTPALPRTHHPHGTTHPHTARWSGAPRRPDARCISGSNRDVPGARPWRAILDSRARRPPPAARGPRPTAGPGTTLH
jgi:hypothetical protein